VTVELEQLALELPPPDPWRDAIALCLVMGEDEHAAAEVAGELLAGYEITGPTLQLLSNLCVLASFQRDDADEFFYSLALEAIPPQTKGP
jgi:hypothetical protein